MELYQIKTEHPVVGFCESRIGGRSENQDSYGYHDTPFGLLVVVCDGMGGGPAGKTASSLAVSEILAGVMESEADTTPMDVLQKAIQRANRALLDAVADNPDLSGMGTTCTALLLNEQSAIMAHVGDSRIYQLRRHGKVFRTFDHSLVFDLVKQKVITEEQARLSDQSNIITRALGMKPELEIDIEERPYKKGDRFLLCTDGIHGTMPEKELIALATQHGELGKVVDGIAAMVDENGRKNGNGHDNLTLTLIETKERSKLKEKMKNKTTLILGLIAVVLAVACLLLNSCKNKDIDVDAFSIEREEVQPGFDTVYIEGTYDFFEDAEAMKLNIGRDSTLSDASSHAVVLTGKDYAVTVRNLQPSTTYYYRYSVNVGQPRDFLTPIKSFNTTPRPPRQFFVKVSAQPEAGGRVTGTGIYLEDQQCSVSAIANEGYAFVNWTENDTVVALDSHYTFNVNDNHTLVAHFESLAPDEYTINVSAHPSNGGTVTGGGTFQEGQTCTVRATANTGYTFVNWTENGNQVSSDANYTFTVNGDRSLVANFTAASYIISATVTPEGSGTITGAGGYENGQSCTLRATANTGYVFEKWTENGTQVSTNAAYTFTVTSSRNLVAHFKVRDYTINVSAQPSNGGTVAGGGTYQYGQSCTVTATASSGYTFSCWKENSNVVSTDASYTFNVSGNRNLVANFVAELPTMYTIAVSANPSEGGTVTGGGTFQQGYSCTVSATANNSYTFTNWTENGSVVSSNASYTFTVNGNRTLVANFTYNGGGGHSYVDLGLPSGTKWATCNVGADSPEEFGDYYAWGETAAKSNYSWGSYQYCQGTDHTLTKYCNNASYGYNGFTDNLTTLVSSDDVATTEWGNEWCMPTKAQWEELLANTTNVWTTQGGVNGRRLTASNGNSIFLPATGFRYNTVLSGVGENAAYRSSSLGNQRPDGAWYFGYDQSQYSMGDYGARRDGLVVRPVRAGSSPQSYTITVSANPSNGGTVSGGGTYQQGQSCTVHAVANSNFTFSKWTENGTQVSTNANYTFTVTGNRTLVAHFTANPQVPTGAIDGLFSVSATKQVYFSQGNLQYQASTNTWRFAEHQYDYIGSANSNISQTYSGWIDLFGWGTSGYNHGAVCYQPWSISRTSSDYFAYGNASSNLFDQTRQADWGFNSITNGGSTINLWRTLSDDEWAYLIDDRTTLSGIRFAKAQIEDVNGLILFPDNWNNNYYPISMPNNGNANYNSNMIDSDVWMNLLQTYGAVFLPAAGYRYILNVGDVAVEGDYWSGTHYFDFGAVMLGFGDYYLDSNAHYRDYRYYGLSVRLVHDY